MIPHSVTDHGLSPTALALYVVLMRYADNDTKKSFPSRQTLAAKLGMKKADSIDRYVVELCKNGLLSVQARWRNAESSRFSFEKNALCKFQTSSEYTIRTEPKSPGRPATRSGGGHGPSETGTNYNHINETRDQTCGASASPKTTTATSESTPSRQTSAYLPGDWCPKPRHHRRAEELGVDIDIAEQKFRDQMHEDKRSNWDSTFMRYLEVGADGRENEEFPSGICEDDSYPNGIHPTAITDYFDCDEYDFPDESDDDHQHDAEPLDAETVEPVSDDLFAGVAPIPCLSPASVALPFPV
ncbi:helix-turn-helix domain-containing protein [Rhodococcus sp. T2V]|uniref:helix-turn-helix domain-containing protein n=1 Tax=Rhodococcus sp. T2V TaxID=3034164 RepID=UPI0023E306A7|nr:helix-turn-helix domain-containing protein [Rhodococcus sp. T2V]MDF3307864.1 helix-turn-helix domain-containing protein [Rhodococcus sp. T2V]